MRKSIALAVTAATTAGLAAFVPATANAANSGSTDLTFSVLSGGLSLDVPDTSKALTAAGGGALTIGQAAGTVSGTLSGVTVTDSRGGLVSAGWKVDLSKLTSFAGKDGTGTTVGSIAGTNGNVTATAVSLTGLTGTNLVVPAVGGVAMDPGGTVVSAPTSPSLINSYSATFDETVSVTIPTDAVPGDYSGTITQTVS